MYKRKTCTRLVVCQTNEKLLCRCSGIDERTWWRLAGGLLHSVITRILLGRIVSVLSMFFTYFSQEPSSSNSSDNPLDGKLKLREVKEVASGQTISLSWL
jgi:hypothetical protein